MAPSWLRRAMLATAAMNLGAAALFLPGAGPLRAIAGFPAGAPPVYLLTIALFVALFGVAYLSIGITGRADPLLVSICAAGKLGFVAVVLGCAVAGTVTWRAVVVASPDAVFGALFLGWLFGRR